MLTKAEKWSIRLFLVAHSSAIKLPDELVFRSPGENEQRRRNEKLMHYTWITFSAWVKNKALNFLRELTEAKVMNYDKT